MAPHTAPATRIVLAALALLAFVTAAQTLPYVFVPNPAEPIGWGETAVISIFRWIGWGVPAPVIIEYGLRFDFRRGRRLASALLHVMMFVGSTLFAWAVMMASIAAVAPPTEVLPSFFEVIGRGVQGTGAQTATLVYVVIIGIGAGVRAWIRARDEAVQSARLEALAAQARSETLAARLQPHFLFNTLHSVGALIHSRPEAAQSMLAELGDLLREALRETPGGVITLREEMALLERYLAIQAQRFQERLRVEMDIAPDVSALPLPRFLMQPLVENALRHGIAPKAAGGRLVISARRTTPSSNGIASPHEENTPAADDALLIRVWNDGAPLASPLRDGVGLATSRERLTMWKPGATLSVRNADDGVETLLTIPQ
jgi:hypothetical protein